MDRLHPELIPTFVAAKRFALQRQSQAIELPDLFNALVESVPAFREQLIVQGFVPIGPTASPKTEIDETQRVTLSAELKPLIEMLSTTGDRTVRTSELLESLEPLFRAEAAKLFKKGDWDASSLSIATQIEPQRKTKLPVLESLAREMTPELLKNPVVGRAEEVGRLSRILTKRYAPNPILVGEPGVGKTAVVEGFVAQLAPATCPRALRGRRVFQISATDLLAGTGIHGSIEKRIKELVEELEAHGDEIILFVDEIHQLVIGGGNSSPGDMLKPALGRGIFPCIGATTLREFNLMERHDPAFCRRFELLPVQEPNESETQEILLGLSETLFSHHRLELPTAELLRTCIELCRDHLSQRRFPDKAISLLDSACALAASESATSVNEHHLRTALAERTGVLSIANVTVIATANFPVGADKPKFGWSIPGGATEAREDIRSDVPDVLINRFDEIIEFKTISKKDAREILTNIILAHANRNYARHQIKLELSDAAVNLILADGYHPDFGVRNLQRSFENFVQPLMVELLVEKSTENNRDWIVDAVDGGGEVKLVRAKL